MVPGNLLLLCVMAQQLRFACFGSDVGNVDDALQGHYSVYLYRTMFFFNKVSKPYVFLWTCLYLWLCLSVPVRVCSILFSSV